MSTIFQEFTLSHKDDDGMYRLPCVKCKKETPHSIACSYDEKGQEVLNDGMNMIYWSCENQIIQCQNCKTVSFRTVSTHSEDADFDFETGIAPERTKYYPDRTITPDPNQDLPYDIQQALDIVRVVGNDAVHPGKLDLKDDLKTVETLFQLVNLISETMITHPKKAEQIDSLYKSIIPKEKREWILERDAKQTK